MDNGVTALFQLEEAAEVHKKVMGRRGILKLEQTAMTCRFDLKSA
jgi:hypothetical protein